ncbi:MFS transporter [Novosphingobium sp. FSY-8]|uniref:MFS transporter n=1 Tax=Novosphingobium ovatum TaxID=1908523 RepID=A0ABW9XBJ6_9SPHN|nr:MFS transporter [Novosphingobium ovatum]NBC35882.1 MFS transporter [Novosphingobium ovatum]
MSQSKIHPVRQHSRILTAALVGTSVEFYDFYIFATATALVFGPTFFPEAAPGRQLLLAFLTFGIAFVARPVGAIAFGHFGDRVGRKSTLVASLMLMGGSTLAVAFLPTYQQAGILAPILLCICRFGQGFGLGGEWGGAALLAVENAPKGWEMRFGSAPQLGAPVGFLAANGLFLALGLSMPDADFKAWGWRVPFLLSVVLVGVGLWVRVKITETAAFAKERAAHHAPPAVPFGELVRNHLPALVWGSAGVVACFALFYLSTAFALAQGTGVLKYARTGFLTAQLAANVFLAAGIIMAAIWSDRYGAHRVLAWGAGAGAVIGMVFWFGLASGSLWVVFATLSAALFAMGMAYGPLGGWLATLFPVQVRYSGVSMAFNVGGIIGGAFTPIIAQQFVDAGKGPWVGVLPLAAAIITLIGIAQTRRRPDLRPAG